MPNLMFLAMLLASTLAAAQNREELRRTPVVEAVERAAPAVVNISTQQLVQPRRRFVDPFFEDLFGDRMGRRQQPQLATTSLGSGLIIDPDGFVVTNEHVVRHADKILVTLKGSEEQHEARLLAADAASDLALLFVDVPDPLPWLPLGRSDDLLIGETTIAIGNPFGLNSTVSVGVVSAIDREIVMGGHVVYDDLLQTDASINPGNSGGPLLNILGEVIGINTAIRADAQGIGFAIPADHVRRVIAELSSPRKLVGGYLGLELDDVLAGGEQAVAITRVEPNSPAAAAGIQSGDTLLEVATHSVTNIVQAHKQLLRFRPADEVPLVVSSGSNTPRAVTLRMSTVPLSDRAREIWTRLGLHGRDVSEAEQGRGLPAGYFVEEVRRGSEAEEIEFRRGDILLGFTAGRRRAPVQSESDLAMLLEQVPAGTVLNVEVWRNGRRMGSAMEMR